MIAGALTCCAKVTRIARPSGGSKAESDSARKSRGGNRTKIIYYNPEPAPGKYFDMIRLRGHDVVATSRVADALMMMRVQSFDALVLDCAKDAVDILNFTARAQGLQPSLAVFLASEWGDELASGLEEFTHVLSMLEDDELASLTAEGVLA